MKNYLLSAGGAVVAMVLLVHSGVANAALIFLLTGTIPGTGYSLSPIVMFALMATGLWLFIAAVSQKIARKHAANGQRARLIHRTISMPDLRPDKARS